MPCLFLCDVLMPYLSFERYLWVHDEVDDRSMKYDDKGLILVYFILRKFTKFFIIV